MHNKVRLRALPILPLSTVLAIIIFGCCISGCRSGDASYNANYTSSTPDTTTPGTSTTGTTTAPTLAWDAPTTFTDGSALLDLKEFRVYFGTSHNPYTTGSYYPVSASSTSVKVKDVISPGTGTYYFVVTAVDAANRESEPSNEVSRYLQ